MDLPLLGHPRNAGFQGDLAAAKIQDTRKIQDIYSYRLINITGKKKGDASLPQSRLPD
jgi:hypothetical protein